MMTACSLSGIGNILPDEGRTVLRVGAKHAGDEAGAEPPLLLIGEQAELAHGVHRGRHAPRRRMGVVVIDPVDQALGRRERSLGALRLDRLGLGRSEDGHRRRDRLRRRGVGYHRRIGARGATPQAAREAAASPAATRLPGAIASQRSRSAEAQPARFRIERRMGVTVRERRQTQPKPRYASVISFLPPGPSVMTIPDS